jgi:hypothetical protein
MSLGLAITDAGEINEAAQWIRREQLHSHFVVSIAKTSS